MNAHPGFEVTLAPKPDYDRFSSALSGTLNIGRIALDLFPTATCGSIVCYMLRRFGNPPERGETYKAIGGAWIITTPSTELFIEVQPSIFGLNHTFSYILALTAEETLRSEGRGRRVRYRPLLTGYEAAARASLADLLRPVAIQGTHLSIVGRVDAPLP